MKRHLFLLGSVFALAFSISARAVEFFRTVDYPIEAAFIPEGFDNNDSVQLVIQGRFPNSCFQVGTVSTELDEETRKLTIHLTAYEYLGPCSTYPALFHVTVQAGLIRQVGSYGVYDDESKRFLGALKIAKAKHVGPGTDEESYPPLTDAFLLNTPEGTELVLRGVMPWSCLEVTDVEILPQAKVVVALPKVEKKADVDCVAGEFSFEHKHLVKEALPNGEFLLHLRAMGGQSINKNIHP